MRSISIFLAALMFLSAAPAAAQFKEGDPGGARVGESRVVKWRVGVEVTAVGGPCKGILGYAPVPVSWPEQEVKVADQDLSPGVKVSYQPVDEIRVMVIRIPVIQSGETQKALVTFEVRRNVQLPPAQKDRDALVLPDVKNLDGPVRRYLLSSPKIEVNAAGVRTAAKTVGANREKAWERVEALYNWAREKVQYKQGGACKGAAAALKDGVGGHEDITSLFIALCRAANIPARTVWVPEFCYAEFYLVDAQGEGHWIPCQPAGSRTFGEMPDTKPILAKGDNFHPPYKSNEKAMRYLAENLTGQPLQKGGRPSVRFVRQLVN
ncbi:MAG: transglutaminase-like domain-containing protein [Thermoguttaceae bacterium]|jgi:hypothetical protein